MNELNEYDDIKKLFSNSETIDNISQYAENDVENIKNVENNEENENDIVNNEKKKRERENNNDEKINRFADNPNHMSNQIFNDVVEL